MLSSRNAGDSNEDVVGVENPNSLTIQETVIKAMLTSGFRHSSTDSKFAYFLPCPLGTFSNITSNKTGECLPCPPGILCSELCLVVSCAISVQTSVK